jgi:DNA repair exonuclease SbcCD ATPase subunit
MNLEERLKALEQKFKSLDSELNQLEGQRTVLSKQLEDAKTKIEELEVTEKLDLRAIEVLNLVQKASREKVTQAFENTVTYALKSIYQDDYEFKLDFGTRGHLGELDFKLRTPGNKEFRGLEHCGAGGSIDIVSLALRFVLLQIIRPKVVGPVFLDEPAKMLRGKDLKQNLFNFFHQMNEKLGRQLIIIPPVDDTEFFTNQTENKILIGKQ